MYLNLIKGEYKNNPVSFALNLENGIPIKSWYDDRGDRELLTLIPILEFLSNVTDVRDYVKLIVNGGEVSLIKFNNLLNGSTNKYNKEFNQYNKESKENKDGYKDNKLANSSRYYNNSIEKNKNSNDSLIKKTPTEKEDTEPNHFEKLKDNNIRVITQGKSDKKSSTNQIKNSFKVREIKDEYKSDTKPYSRGKFKSFNDFPLSDTYP